MSSSWEERPPEGPAPGPTPLGRILGVLPVAYLPHVLPQAQSFSPSLMFPLFVLTGCEESSGTVCTLPGRGHRAGLVWSARQSGNPGARAEAQANSGPKRGCRLAAVMPALGPGTQAGPGLRPWLPLWREGGGAGLPAGHSGVVALCSGLSPKRTVSEANV